MIRCSSAMIIILLLICTAAFQGKALAWNGIDPCLDEIQCFGEKFNINVSNPENCSQYFVCNETSLYPYSCPVGLTFDQNVLLCLEKTAIVIVHCAFICLDLSYKDHIVYKSMIMTSSSESSTSTTIFPSFPSNGSSTTMIAQKSSSYESSLSPIPVVENSTVTSTTRSSSWPSTLELKSSTSSRTESSRVSSVSLLQSVSSPTSTISSSAQTTKSSFGTFVTSPSPTSPELLSTFKTTSSAQSTTKTLATTSPQLETSTSSMHTITSTMSSPTFKSTLSTPIDTSTFSTSTVVWTSTGFSPNSTRNNTNNSSTSVVNLYSKNSFIISTPAKFSSVIPVTALSQSSHMDTSSPTNLLPSSSPPSESSSSSSLKPMTTTAFLTSSSLKPMTTTAFQTSASHKETTTATSRNILSFSSLATTTASMSSPTTTAVVQSSQSSSIQKVVTSSLATSTIIPSSMATTWLSSPKANTSNMSSPQQTSTYSRIVTDIFSSATNDYTSTASISTSSKLSISSTISGTVAGDETTPYSPTELLELCNRQSPCRLGDIFGDVVDCRSYFVCMAVAENSNYWLPATCDENHLFDANTKKCVEESASNAKCLQSICQPRFYHVLEMSPMPALANRPLSFLCAFKVVFVVQPIQLKGVTWFLDGHELKSDGSTKRIRIETAPIDSQGFWNSTLFFDPATTRDFGSVECLFEFGYEQRSNQTRYFQVLSIPSVEINPLNAVVKRNETISMTCRVLTEETDQEYSHGNDFYNSSGSLDIIWFRGNQMINLTTDDQCWILNPSLDALNSQSILVCRPQSDEEYYCRVISQLGYSDSQICSVKLVDDDVAQVCLPESISGVNWTMTLVNRTSRMQCTGPSVGFMTRGCTSVGNASVWEDPDMDGCVNRELSNLLSQAQDVSQGIRNEDSNTTEKIAQSLQNYLSTSLSGLSFGDFNASLEILKELNSIHVAAWNITRPSLTEIQSVFSAANSLLNSSNVQLWNLLIRKNPYGSVTIMNVVNTYGRKWANSLDPGMNGTFVEDNLAISTMCNYQQAIHNLSFPLKNDEYDWMKSSVDSVYFQNSPDYGDGNATYYISSSFYKNLNMYLPHSDVGSKSNSSLGSRVISLTIDGLSATKHLKIPVRIMLETSRTTKDDLNRSCVFWNSSITPNGSWSDFGCRVVPSEPSKWTVCECNHLTNFAILFFPPPAQDLHQKNLRISNIGCIISVVFNGLTILLYAARWKSVRSSHSVILINLCICLIIANTVFLSGVDRTALKVPCIVVAALLHYFFLSAFFIMLVEGILLFLYIAFPFHISRKRETFLLLLAAWVIPLIIVGLSLAITRTKGYGGPDNCWLSLDNGVLWAFVGPALTVIAINFTIMVVVLVKVGRTKNAEEQTQRRRILATVWNVMLICPVLGVTWVFGVVSVNRDLDVFQCIFAIANSLQGFLIFIFHGICYKKHRGSKTLVNESSANGSLEHISEYHQEEQQEQQPIGPKLSAKEEARLQRRMRRLERHHGINWAAIAAATPLDELELSQFDDVSEIDEGLRNEGFMAEENFSSSLHRPSKSSSPVSRNYNSVSTDRTDILF